MPRITMGKTLVLLILFVKMVLLQGCTNLMFAPMKHHVMTPDQIRLDYADIIVHASDGVKLHGWHLPAVGAARGSILFLHGNGENISTHLATVYWLPAAGYEVFMLDYRGYGWSEGMTDLSGSALDAEAALVYVLEHKSSPGKPIVLGHSFGGSIAIYTVANSMHKNEVSALVSIGAFSDYRKVTQDVLSRSWLTWLFQWPLSLTMNNDLSPLRFVDRISPVPLLIMHGEQDEIVPYYHGEALYRQAKQPKTFVALNGDHNHVFRKEENRQRLLDYLNSLP